MFTQCSGIRIPRFATKKAAESLVGTLSRPSKMPCHGYSLPASACQVGSKLTLNPNSPCSECYAKKRRYMFPNVQQAMHKRLSSINDPNWVDAMVFLIKRTGDKFFRWHDSGDIQSLQHLHKIVTVAHELPEVTFWLPTQEYKYVKQYNDDTSTKHIPSNLIIRISSPTYDKRSKITTWCTSTVVSDPVLADGHLCPAPSQGNQCGECRACWDASVVNVNYLKH